MKIPHNLITNAKYKGCAIQIPNLVATKTRVEF